MTARSLTMPALLCAAVLLPSCGDNLSAPGPGGTILQGGLTALSVNTATVRFGWSAVQGLPDSVVRGYLATWTGGRDSLPPSARSLVIDSLSPGEVTFTIQALVSIANQAPQAVMRWAPAARFDTPLLLTEYYVSQPDRPAGLDLGGTNADPATFAVDPGNPQVGQVLDLYLYGGEGEFSDPLVLRSAHLLVGSWNQTLFSTVTDSSSTLDFPLSRFPGADTFTLDAVPVTENTIVYARVQGNEGGIHVVRLLIGTVTGSGRTRSLGIRVSLQRVPGLPFAQCDPDTAGPGRAV